ncbi:MAG TPA: hypothetical protein EYP56_07450 [Planctomycetaceae bacterium]|nr:hypothetical protein [Planctomycetaceae bacterium]
MRGRLIGQTVAVMAVGLLAAAIDGCSRRVTPEDFAEGEGATAPAEMSPQQERSSAQPTGAPEKAVTATDPGGNRNHQPGDKEPLEGVTESTPSAIQGGDSSPEPTTRVSRAQRTGGVAERPQGRPVQGEEQAGAVAPQVDQSQGLGDQAVEATPTVAPADAIPIDQPEERPQLAEGAAAADGTDDGRPAGASTAEPFNPLRAGRAGMGPLRSEGAGGEGHPAFRPASTEASHEGGRQSKKYDPIAENGPIFVGWPKPQLALVLTGCQNGYLEPCGCAGLDRMKGGLGRRHTFMSELRNKRSWPVVALDVGGLIKGFGRQAEMKFHTTVSAMQLMQYETIALGANDLRLPAAELLAVAAPVDGKTLFVSGNVALFKFEYGMTARYEVIRAGGRKVGVTAVLGKSFQQKINNPELEIIAPEEALAELVPVLKPQCDLLVLLAHASRDESIALGKAFPEFDVVVTAGGPAEPPLDLAHIDGTSALLVEVGQKGMYAVVLGFYQDEAVRYQRVPLDSRFPYSPDVKLLMVNYQDQLRQVGFEGLGVRPVPHSRREELGAYVGSQKCQSCHEVSYRVWRKSGHARAWRTLVHLDPPRTHDPECVSCHVVGWNPEYYYPYETGFWSEEKTPELVDVGCESCHGPGEAHVKAEMGSDLALQRKLQQAVTLTLEDAKKQQCITCHDGENSPDFKFETYWPKIEHREWEDE